MNQTVIQYVLSRLKDLGVTDTFSMGVPATVANTAEEFHEQFAAAMENKGPRFIDAKFESITPVMVDMMRQAYEAANT